jgi:hypothetical protein
MNNELRISKDCQFSMAGHLYWMKQQKLKKKMLGTRAMMNKMLLE